MNDSVSASHPTQVSPQLLEEAADWVMLFRFGAAGERDQREFERWRARSPAHSEAWNRAEAVLGTFEKVRTDIGKPASQALQSMNRRRALRLFSTLLAAAPAAWLASRAVPWEEWAADETTATGERKSLELSDGTSIVLNTATAIDIAFTASERRIVLRAGEILVTTHRDPSPTYRPFLVQTPQGIVQALGTRFSVRRLDGLSRVDVFEHAVEIRPGNGVALTLRAGQRAVFGTDNVETPQVIDESTVLWERGMLVAKNMRLGDVVAELSRYRSGVLRCHPSVVDLRVSGALSVADTDSALEVLERTLPLRVSRINRYWVTVEPR